VGPGQGDGLFDPVLGLGVLADGVGDVGQLGPDEGFIEGVEEARGQGPAEVDAGLVVLLEADQGLANAPFEEEDLDPILEALGQGQGLLKDGQGRFEPAQAHVDVADAVEDLEEAVLVPLGLEDLPGPLEPVQGPGVVGPVEVDPTQDPLAEGRPAPVAGLTAPLLALGQEGLEVVGTALHRLFGEGQELVGLLLEGRQSFPGGPERREVHSPSYTGAPGPENPLARGPGLGPQWRP